MSQIMRKETLVAVAAVGIAIVIWSLRDTISEFLFGSSCSNPREVPVETRAPAAKAQESSPKASSERTSQKSAEKTNDAENAAGSVAPEAMEQQKPTTPSVYVGLPKADPATISSTAPPSQWPGATPM